MSELNENLKTLSELIKKASSREALDSCFKKWREEVLTPLKTQIAQSTSKAEKKELGLKFQNLLKTAQELYDYRKLELSTWAQPFYRERECLQKENREVRHSSNNLLGSLLSDVFEFLRNNKFDFYEESEIVKVSTNFDSLLIPPEHPARESSDSFFLDYLGKEENNDPKMLRTHTTTSTISLLEKNKGISFRGASAGSVYRKEDNNSTHLSQFTQLDFVWVDSDLTINHLRNLIESLLSTLFKKEQRNYRLRFSYFPFTSPSFEVDLSCNCNIQNNCSLCKGTGWIEILGSGFLRVEILNKTHPGKVAIAAGLGLERIAMVKYRLVDIRDLYRNDLSSLVVNQ